MTILSSKFLASKARFDVAINPLQTIATGFLQTIAISLKACHQDRRTPM
jgi:hypothetical protein